VQGENLCGNLHQDCCYEPGKPLCSQGSCNPGTPLPDISNFKAWPCLCTDTVCVNNAEYCPVDAICDQTAILEDCGGYGEPCCSGISCSEEDEDNYGTAVSLLCDQSFYNETSGQSTRCWPPPEQVLDQSFGTGGPGEKCNSGDTCDKNDPALECLGGPPMMMHGPHFLRCLL
jgi:hypothetical protein